MYDTAQIAEAAWVGIPAVAWPGFDVSFGPTFWALLPAFVFVTLVGAIETIGDSVAIQRVSWRRDRAVDFRTVQGAVAADGVVPGGVVALARAAFALSDAPRAARDPLPGAFARVLQAPFRRIAAGAGLEPSIALETLRETERHVGFDGQTGAFRDFRKAGIVDAAKVVSTALTSANAAAGQLVSTDCAVALARRPDAV